MPGRLLKLNLINIGLEDKFRFALKNLGMDLDDLYKEEKE
jgi:starch phosphorylase